METREITTGSERSRIVSWSAHPTGGPNSTSSPVSRLSPTPSQTSTPVISEPSALTPTTKVCSPSGEPSAEIGIPNPSRMGDSQIVDPVAGSNRAAASATSSVVSSTGRVTTRIKSGPIEPITLARSHPSRPSWGTSAPVARSMIASSSTAKMPEVALTQITPSGTAIPVSAHEGMVGSWT